MSEVYGGQRLCECCGAVITADRRRCDACTYKVVNAYSRPAPVQVPEGMVLVSRETAEGAADWLREYAAELRGRHCVSEGVWGPYRIDMQAKAGHAAMLELADSLAAAPAPATVATEAVPHAYQYGTALMWPDDLSDEDKREALPLYAVATEAVAQGGGVDVEAVCGAIASALDDKGYAVDYERFRADVVEAAGPIIRSISASPAGVGWCTCEACVPRNQFGGPTMMSLCRECGDKRCPKAKHHGNACAAAPAIANQGEGE